MINVIVPVVEDAEKFSNFIQNTKKTGVKFFVGVHESLAKNFSKSKDVELHIYGDKANKEEIINSLHTCKMKKGKVLILRRVLTEDEWTKLTSSSGDIATLKAKHNKFVTAIKNFGSMIVRKFFAFNFFEDISAICYGESMFELVSVCANLSMATRVNRYVGLDIQEFETESKQVKKQYSHWKTISIFLLWTLVLLGSIAGGTLVCIFTEVWSLTILLVIFWIIVAIMFWLVALINFMRAITVGDLRYGRAEELTGGTS